MFRRRRRVRPVTIDPATGAPISPLPFIGAVLMASSFFLYAASGLLVPWWVWLLLMATWLLLLPSTLREWQERPRRPLVVGAASIVLWFVVALGGGLLVGWDPWWGSGDWFA